MNKTITDYSKETELYSKWRVLKAQQINEFMKLALAPKTHNAPKPKLHLSTKTEAARVHMVIAIIISAIVGLIVAISQAAYETVVVLVVAVIVTIVLAIRFLSKYSKDKAAYKKLLATHHEAKKAIASFDMEQIKQKFTQLGQQADEIATALGVIPAELEKLHKKAQTGDGIDCYRHAVELICEENHLVCEAYSQGRPNPFIDSGLATSPEGAKQKQEDFSLYALYFSYVEGHLGYMETQPIWYNDHDQVKLREYYKELKIVK